jgi:hypothetical protein
MSTAIGGGTALFNHKSNEYMTKMSRILGCMLLAFGIGPAVSLAQDVDPPPAEWAFEGEAGASIFFGASDQTTIAARIGLDRESAQFKMENDISYLYGESSGDEGNTFVNKRSWSIGSNLDFQSFSRVNPYLFGSANSSLEKAIRIRYKGGTGAKFSAVESEKTQLDLSVAVLAEKTFEQGEEDGGSETLARYSGAFNFRQEYSEGRTVFDAKAEYSPVFDESDNYTVRAEAGIAFKVTEVVMLRLSVVDNYDSRAENRGAADNNDGRVLFSVLSSF